MAGISVPHSQAHGLVAVMLISLTAHPLHQKHERGHDEPEQGHAENVTEAHH
jgi:hypothetical protein